MSRSLKKGQPSVGKNGGSEEKMVPTGIVIINCGRELFIKKEFVPGFGYENGSKKKKPLDHKTFHQVINNELPKKQKGRGQKTEIVFIGPNPSLMGRNHAQSFENFVKENGLVKGRYEVKEVTKQLQKIKELQLEAC